MEVPGKVKIFLWVKEVHINIQSSEYTTAQINLKQNQIRVLHVSIGDFEVLFKAEHDTVFYLSLVGVILSVLISQRKITDCPILYYWKQ